MFRNFTRFELERPFPHDYLDILRKYSFQSIDEINTIRGFGWTSFDDMLDTDFERTPTQKGEYICFALRLDTRRISSSVLKKEERLAFMQEEKKLQEIGSRKYITKERRIEIKEQVKLRLLARMPPIPSFAQVIIKDRTVYFNSNNTKMVELFVSYFAQSFDTHFAKYVNLHSQIDDAFDYKTDPLKDSEKSLMWLWFLSDKTNGTIALNPKKEPHIFYPAKKVSIVTGTESAVGGYINAVSGSNDFQEIRLGLEKGKKIAKAQFCLERGELGYAFTLDTAFNVTAFRSLNAISKDSDDGADGIFLEEMFLFEYALECIDELGEKYIEEYLKNGVEEQAKLVQEWVEGK